VIDIVNERPKMKNHNRRGMTLVEIMIVVLILSVVLLGMYAFFSAQSAGISMSKAAAEIDKNGNVLSTFMLGELQTARKWNEATINKIQFVNQEGVVEYEYVPGDPIGTLYRRIGGSETIMAPDVESVEFHFFSTYSVDGPGSNELDPGAGNIAGSIGMVEARFVIRSKNPVHTSDVNQTPIKTDNPLTPEVESDGRLRRLFSIRTNIRNIIR